MWKEYLSFSKSERIIEAHKEYVDIQFLVEGCEEIGYSYFSPENKIKEMDTSQKELFFTAN